MSSHGPSSGGVSRSRHSTSPQRLVGPASHSHASRLSRLSAGSSHKPSKGSSPEGKISETRQPSLSNKGSAFHPPQSQLSRNDIPRPQAVSVPEPFSRHSPKHNNHDSNEMYV